MLNVFCFKKHRKFLVDSFEFLKKFVIKLAIKILIFLRKCACKYPHVKLITLATIKVTI